jgi:hypothetical protein
MKKLPFFLVIGTMLMLLGQIAWADGYDDCIMGCDRAYNDCNAKASKLVNDIEIQDAKAVCDNTMSECRSACDTEEMNPAKRNRPAKETE